MSSTWILTIEKYFMHKLICAPVYSVNDVQLLRAERLLFFEQIVIIINFFEKERKRNEAIGFPFRIFVAFYR